MAVPKTPLLTTDCVIFDDKARVLLIRRRNEPFKGAFALPGGFVDIGETVDEACRREVLEETGLKVDELKLVGVYSDPARDPRGHTVSAAYVTMLSQAQQPRPGSDAATVEWVDNWRQVEIAFDHAKIIADAERVRSR
jgi:8-oxo-dGTP diphosphatase